MAKGQRFWYHTSGPLHSPGYYHNHCSICGGKALYRWAGKVFCSYHKSAAYAWVRENPKVEFIDEVGYVSY